MAGTHSTLLSHESYLRLSLSSHLNHFCKIRHLFISVPPQLLFLVQSLPALALKQNLYRQITTNMRAGQRHGKMRPVPSNLGMILMLLAAHPRTGPNSITFLLFSLPPNSNRIMPRVSPSDYRRKVKNLKVKQAQRLEELRHTGAFTASLTAIKPSRIQGNTH